MSRLASFQGPSTPSKTPVNSSEQPSPSPSSKGKKSTKPKQQQGKIVSGALVQSLSSSPSPSPARPSPSHKNANAVGSPNTIARNEPPRLDISPDIPGFIEMAVHKRLRQILFEVRSATRRWEEVTKGDGFKAAKEIVDARTLIENALALVPKDKMPSRVIVGPHMNVINEGIRRLDGVIANLEVLLSRMNTLLESLEALHVQALNDFYDLPAATSAPTLNPNSPLYPNTTWSLPRFTTLLPKLILPYYARSLVWHQSASRRLTSSQLKWEDARVLLGAWRDGDYWERDVDGREGKVVCVDGVVLECGWSNELEDICTVEIYGWR